MRLVCFTLPEIEIAGSAVRLSIPADVGWLVQCSRQHLTDMDSRQLLAHSPILLIWCLAHFDDLAAIQSPDQLVCVLESVLSAPSGVDSNANANLATGRQKKFIRALRQLNRESNPGNSTKNTAVTVQPVFKSLVRLIARVSGLARRQATKWLQDRNIDTRFWIQLAKWNEARTSIVIPVSGFWPESPVIVPEKAGDSEFNRRLHNEKLASLKRLAYGASHEINNPLANIASRAQTLLRDEPDPERRKKLAKINQQAFRAHEMIADMMLFAHPPQPQFEMIDAEALIRRLINEMQPLARDQGTELEFEIAGNAQLVADPSQVLVALKALIQNSLEALAEGGKILVSTGICDNDQGLEMIVADTGPGFSDSQIDHVFDPFFSGREAGRGLGFGLSKAWRIVELHGGQIFAENVSHSGARVRIRIPYRANAA